MRSFLPYVIAGLGVSLSLADSSTQPVPGTVNVPLDLVTVEGKVGPVYLVNVSIGNPPQTVQVQADTGSSDLWVFSNKNNCNVTMGCIGGSFNPSASSTYKSDLPGQFEWQYGSGHNGSGDYFRDDVTIGGVTLKNLRVGLSLDTDGESPIYAILGLGVPENEFLPDQRNNTNASYPNLPVDLANQGLIGSSAFSIYLNDVDQDGSILFGGVDQAKYSGPRKEFPALKPGGGHYSQYYVNLTAVGLTTSNGTSWSANGSTLGAAFIDSGSPKAYLPSVAASPILQEFGGEWDPDAQLSIIPCSAKNHTGSVDFVITSGEESVLIQTPVHQLIDPYPNPNPPMIAGEPACNFGVSPGPDDFIVLGDAFLRGAYATFDIGKHTVALAEAKLGVEESSVSALTR